MTAQYNRTSILSFSELSDDQKDSILMDLSFEQAENDSYVILNEQLKEGSALALSNFIRTPIGNTGHYKGVFGMSYFSCYTLYVSKDGSEAVIAYQHF
jgi:hypothetical protein